MANNTDNIHSLDAIKGLLKKVSGCKRGKNQHDLIMEFSNAHNLDKSNFVDSIEKWPDQLANGIIEPIYEVYRAMLKKILAQAISTTISAHNINQDIIPLVAVYSQFTQCRISIYNKQASNANDMPLGNKLVSNYNGLKFKVRDSNVIKLNKLDDYLSSCSMSQVLYATRFVKDKKNKFPFQFDRPTNTDFNWNNDAIIILNDLDKLRSNTNHSPVNTTTNYLDALSVNYTLLNNIDKIDFARTSLLTSHEHIYVFDLSFYDGIFGHRSVVLLSENKLDFSNNKISDKYKYLAYEIDHILSSVLAFEANLKTYDMFLRSSDFVLKRDQAKWDRINTQIDFGRQVKQEIDNRQNKNKTSKHYHFISSNKKIQFSLSNLYGLLPEIQDSLDAAEHTAYRMPRYFSKSFKTLLLKEGIFEPKRACELYTNILQEVKNCFYDLKIKKPITPDEYIKIRYYNRYETRMKEARWLVKLLLHKFKNDAHSGNLDSSDTEKRYKSFEALSILDTMLNQVNHQINVKYSIKSNDTSLQHYSNKVDNNANYFNNICKNISRERSSNGREQSCLNSYIQIDRLKSANLTITPDKKHIRLIHGDLHFDNILIDPFDLNNPIDKLIDPGDFYISGGDIAYDIGKLMLSFNGFYDFIHEDLFELSCDYVKFTDNIFDFDFKIIADGHVFKNPIVSGASGAEVNIYSPLYGGEIVNYLYIRERNKEIIKDIFCTNDSTFGECDSIIRRSEFNEALNFLTGFYFHLKNDPRKALAIYITGLILMNRALIKENI